MLQKQLQRAFSAKWLLQVLQKQLGEGAEALFCIIAPVFALRATVEFFSAERFP
ncbi:hypothetical protein [Gordoniibacillus kamchatkensis]|uniref:hypothetical protein n=1 Tax=Gordoniibacillus kamchatkensis TaxID=1590651 RepID=UPI0012E03F0F|nr:hypothetical protein [Paenibacillus sp. VKM B-2647]